MENKKDIVSLLKAFTENDLIEIRTVALREAAKEAREGREEEAKEIKELTDKFTFNTLRGLKIDYSLLANGNHGTNFSDLYLPEPVRKNLDLIIYEYRRKEKIKSYGLRNINKIYFRGAAGTGKTSAADALAGELKLPFFIIKTEKMEDGTSCDKVFDIMEAVPGVYLMPSAEKLKNTVPFLRGMDRIATNSILIIEGHNSNFFDENIRKKTDLTVYFNIPSYDDTFEPLIRLKLEGLAEEEALSRDLFYYAGNLSQREISLVCERLLKRHLDSEDKISAKELALEFKKQKEM